MKFSRFLAPVWAMVLAGAASAAAQPTQYTFVFNGTSSTTDSTGKIVTTQINNQTLLQEFGKLNGITDLSPYGLAYHLGGNDLGDTIEVVNRHDGTSVYTLLGLYFGEDFGRTSLFSASHRQMKRLEYIYTDQNSHSLGSALLTDYFFLDGKGNTNSITVFGNLQWIVTPNALHSDTVVRSGSFTTLQP